MLSCDALREVIKKTDAASEIVEALSLKYTPDEFVDSAPDQLIVDAFATGATLSTGLRQKLHNRDIPEPGTQNLSKNQMNYELGRAFWHAKAYTDFAEKYGASFSAGKNILDFGCGTSRLLRYLVDFAKGPNYFGSEVNPENIAWGRKVYPEVTYLHHDPVPPIPIEDERFDVIYAQSIFSHYSESAHKEWLTELHRTLVPGGLLMLTIEGEHVVERYKSEEALFSTLDLSKEVADGLWRTFDDTGFAFFTRYNTARLKERNIDTENWGTAFISEAYIRENWTSMFNVLETVPGGVFNLQDYVILRKCSVC